MELQHPHENPGVPPVLGEEQGLLVSQSHQTTWKSDTGHQMFSSGLCIQHIPHTARAHTHQKKKEVESTPGCRPTQEYPEGDRQSVRQLRAGAPKGKAQKESNHLQAVSQTLMGNWYRPGRWRATMLQQLWARNCSTPEKQRSFLLREEPTQKGQIQRGLRDPQVPALI